MLWRFRCVLIAHVELPEDVGILSWRATISKLETGPKGENAYRADFFVEAQDSKQAYYLGLAKAYQITDALSHRSLSPAQLQPISATLPSVGMNVPFEITIADHGESQNCALISIHDCGELLSKEPKETSDLQRSLREALCAHNPIHAFSILWGALEPLLETMARNQDLWSPQRECAHCNQPLGDRMPSTQKALQSLLDLIHDASVTDKIDAKGLRKIRGKIVHGSDIGDPEFRVKVEGALATLLSVVATAVCMHEKTQTSFPYRAVSNHKLTTFDMRFCATDQVQINWGSPASAINSIAMIKIPDGMHQGQENIYRFGLWEQPGYNQLHLPDLIP